MFKRPIIALTALAMTAGAALATGALAAAMKGDAQAHIGHVMNRFEGTPQNIGLLPTAIMEAQSAYKHAELAAAKPNDLRWIKMHTLDAMNAVDPSVQGEGGGLGYGLLRAASGIKQHIGFASESKGASENVKTHTKHVRTMADNVTDRARQILQVGAEVQRADNLKQALDGAHHIRDLAYFAVEGRDANGDGQISWHDGEGGLEQIAHHMTLMMKGEGMTTMSMKDEEGGMATGGERMDDKIMPESRGEAGPGYQNPYRSEDAAEPSEMKR